MTSVAMIAPITHAYPPSGYGPWERVTHDLTERLVVDGHEVTLFAAADSETSARLVPTAHRPLSQVAPEHRRGAEDRHIERAIQISDAESFDVVHSHLHVHVLRHVDRLSRPLLTTLHGAAWDRAHHQTLNRHAHRPYVSLSDRERLFLPDLNYVATIPNGIRLEDFPEGAGGGGYLVFVGRLAPEKAPYLAVECARRSGLALKIAGVIEDAHRGFAETFISETGGGVEYVGALDRPELSWLMREAEGLLMPLTWDEPFGLVVIESLASGTPVIAWRRGAMPEIIDDGVTGFLVDDTDDAVGAVQRLDDISRRSCRLAAETRFSDAVMAERYAALYKELAVNPSPPAAHPEWSLRS